MEPESVLWGWERFFEELAAFLRDLNRQAGTANESYCEYAVERLEICLQSVSSLVHQRLHISLIMKPVLLHIIPFN